MKESDYLDMVNGKLNGQMAFMSGKLKIAGDMGLALRLQNLFAPPRGRQPADGDRTSRSLTACPRYSMPEGAKGMDAVFQFDLTD